MNTESVIRLLVVAAALVAALVGTASASAGHDHYLVTPGTCVEDVARGQTAQTEGGGFHRFHENVHLGTPGASAFANPQNPNTLGKGDCP